MAKFKAIATLSSGFHKILSGLDKRQVAHAVSQFRKSQMDIFDNDYILNFGEYDKLDLKTVVKLKFLHNGQEYLTVN